MHRSNLYIILFSAIVVILLVTSILFFNGEKRAKLSTVSNPVVAQTSFQAPTDPYSPTVNGIPISITVSKYPKEDQDFIQEVENQLLSWNIADVLPDRANPETIYYAFNTDNTNTQIRSYSKANDTTFSKLNWPLVENGSVEINNNVPNIPAGQKVHLVDILNGNVIYAISNNQDIMNVDDACESPILHYEHAPLYSISTTNGLPPKPYTFSSTVLTSETQAQQTCQQNQAK